MQGLGRLARTINTRAEELIEHIVLICSDDQMLNW